MRIRYPLLTAIERIAAVALLCGIGLALPNVVFAVQTTPVAAPMSPTERLLDVAARYSRTEDQNRSMLWLLAHGANAAAVTPGEPHFGALGLLYDQGYSSDGFESGRLLRGPDKKGRTALMYAAEVGSCEPGVVRFLIKHGAKLNARSREGLTALDYAEEFISDSKETAAIMNMLRKFGGKPGATTK